MQNHIFHINHIHIKSVHVDSLDYTNLWVGGGVYYLFNVMETYILHV